MSTAQSNPFLLAADNPTRLLTLLRSDPSLAACQDEHGYSLMHAAASYSHPDLLRALANEFKVPVDLKDEDGETALFVAETVETAKILVEELHSDVTIRGEDGKTAREKIELDGEFPLVALYLLKFDGVSGETSAAETSSSINLNDAAAAMIGQPPPLPEGITIDVGTMAPEAAGGEVVDTEFRRRIQELAARGDFQGEAGQNALRELITEAIRGQASEGRDVRQRTD